MSHFKIFLSSLNILWFYELFCFAGLTNCITKNKFLYQEFLHYEFKDLLQQEKREHLGRMYTLVTRRADFGRRYTSVLRRKDDVIALRDMEHYLQDHIWEQGLAALEENEEIAQNDPKIYVTTILDVHNKYNDLVLTAFKNDRRFVAALDEACKEFINNNAVTR